MDRSFILGFGCIVLAGLADFILTRRWNRAYFTYGIPIFVRRIPKPAGIADLSLEELETSSRTAGGAPLLFHRLDPNVIAFRDQVFGGTVHYVPIMHGVIRYDATEGVVRVTGLLNWFVIAFIAVFTALLGRKIVELLPMLALVYGVIYLIQFVRYNRVAKKLAQPA